MTNPAPMGAVTDERAAFEAAMKETWGMVDVHRPAGEPGSYYRGEHNGIVAALRTVRDNWERQLAALPSAPAPLQVAADSRPTEPGLYAWAPERGHPSLVLVDRRPSATQPGHQLNGHVIPSSTFYDGCAISTWPKERWINLRAAALQVAQPAARMPLTEEQVKPLVKSCYATVEHGVRLDGVALIRAVERLHGITNEQEGKSHG